MRTPSLPERDDGLHAHPNEWDDLKPDDTPGYVRQRMRELVADESAATSGQDRGAVSETCRLPLAFSAGRSSEPAAVRSHAGPDRVATDTDGIGGWWSSQQRNPSTA